MGGSGKKTCCFIENLLTFPVYLKRILKSQFCCPLICGRKCWGKIALVTEFFDFSCIFEADSKKPILLPSHLWAEVLGKNVLVTESFDFLLHLERIERILRIQFCFPSFVGGFD